MDGTTHPLIVRAEVGPGKPIVFTGHVGVRGESSSGVRVDLPFFRRLNATAVYLTADGRADVFNSTPKNAKSRTIMLGVRTAEVRR